MMDRFFKGVGDTHVVKSDDELNNPAPFHYCTRQQLIDYYYSFNKNKSNIEWNEIVNWYEVFGWTIKQISVDNF
jgi:hypothetical protein